MDFKKIEKEINKQAKREEQYDKRKVKLAQDVVKGKRIFFGPKPIYMKEEAIRSWVRNFTQKDADTSKMIEDLKKFSFVESVEKGRTIKIVLTDGEVIEFNMFSDYINPEEPTYDELLSSGREQKCCETSLVFANIFEQGLGTSTDVATGWHHRVADKFKFLHSWIEFTDQDGKEKCADYTLNIIMNKEGFYRMQCISEVLNRVSATKIREDRSKELDNVELKMYLLYRDQIIEELERRQKGRDDGR